jgi:hypothetical protein
VLGRAAKTVTAAGRVTITVKLSRSAQRYLARHKTAKLTLRTSFGGRSRTTAVKR